MSSHEGHGHHGPTTFLTKYVFSTDHKVIAIQFMFTALLFVILGGLLALAVRYQLAWPNQNVPYAEILPGKMTNRAPEANLGLWKIGGAVELASDVVADGQTLPAGAVGVLEGFPKGLAVTIPVGTIVTNEAGRKQTLDEPVEGFIDPELAMGDYNYKKLTPEIQTTCGAVVTVHTGDDDSQEQLKLAGFEQWVHDASGRVQPIIVNSPINLPIRAAATPVSITVSQQDIKDRDGNVTAKVSQSVSSSMVMSRSVRFYKETLTTDAYLSLFTMHASIMIFLVIIPMLVGAFGNFLIPLMVGARDMAFPKLNMLAFWLAVPAGLILVASFWTTGGSAGGGWTMYPPLSEIKFTAQLGTTLWIAAVGLVGFSSVVGALNYITTIVNMRAPGMTMFRMPLTVWSLFITSMLALFATPVLTAAMVLLLLDRTLGTHFFVPETGGQPLMFQHLFWFYSHPAVYIMILPAMGVTSDILACFARKPIFGYRADGLRHGSDHWFGLHRLGSSHVPVRDEPRTRDDVHGIHHHDCGAQCYQDVQLAGYALGWQHPFHASHAQCAGLCQHVCDRGTKRHFYGRGTGRYPDARHLFHCRAYSLCAVRWLDVRYFCGNLSLVSQDVRSAAEPAMGRDSLHHDHPRV